MTWTANVFASSGGVAPSSQPPCTGDAWAESWAGASEAERDRARARLAAVRRSDELAGEGCARADADACAAAEAGVSAKSVAKWRRRAQGLAAGARVAALLDGVRTGRPSTIDAAQAGELAALIYQHGRHLTARHAERTLRTRTGGAPSRSTIKRFIARYWDAHGHELCAVLNPDRHRSHHQPAGGDADEVVVALNQLWELDSTRGDVLCANGKRYALVAGVEVFSRRGEVLVVPESSGDAIAALVRRCILKWGMPQVAKTDEGRDYRSRRVRQLFADLEVEHFVCPPYTPEAKPFVERFFGTLARDLLAFLPGFTGHDVAQAQALRAQKSFSDRRGDDARRTYRVSLTAEELQARIDAWCASIYEHRPHDGLGGRTPFEVAAGWTGALRRVGDVRALDLLLEPPERRKVWKEGIKIDSGTYIAAELGWVMGQWVQVRRDPADLGRIHVYRDVDGRCGAFVCVAEDPVRTGIDRAEVATRMRANWKAVNREARSLARDLKRRYSPETAMDDVLGAAGAAADKVVALPRKGEAHETPALAAAGDAAQAADAPVPSASRAARGRKGAVAAAARRFYLDEGA